MKFKAGFIVLLFAVVFACKKKGEETTPKNTLELLTGGNAKTWRVKSGIGKQGDLEINLVASQGPCITDNLIKLYKDFTYEFTEGATKCHPSDPDLIVKANWTLASDNSSISIDRLIFLNRVIEKPVFTLTEVSETVFSGKTTVTVENQTIDLYVTFENVSN
jgi:hypothetical protein